MTDLDAHQATVVISRRVAPGRDLDFQRWLGRLRRAVEQAPGFAGAAFHPPQHEHPGEWLITYRFTDPTSLDQWLSSPVRTELIEATPRRDLGERHIGVLGHAFVMSVGSRIPVAHVATVVAVTEGDGEEFDLSHIAARSEDLSGRRNLLKGNHFHGHTV